MNDADRARADIERLLYGELEPVTTELADELVTAGTWTRRDADRALELARLSGAKFSRQSGSLVIPESL